MTLLASSNKIRPALLFICGLVISIYSFQRIQNIRDYRFMPCREKRLHVELDALSKGLPILTMADNDLIVKNIYYSDDLGNFIILPYVMFLLNCSIETAAKLFIGFNVAMVVFALVFVFFALSRSYFLSIFLTSLISVEICKSIEKIQGVVYYIWPCALSLCIWLLILLYKRLDDAEYQSQNSQLALGMGKSNIFLVLLLSIIASYSNFMRINCGLCVFLSLATVLAFGIKKQNVNIKLKISRAAIVFLMIVFFYMAIHPFVTYTLSRHSRSYVREHQKSSSPVELPSILSHPLWHNIYCGLGYNNTENKYGIQ